MLEYKLTIESRIATPNAAVEIGTYNWLSAGEDCVRTKKYALCLTYHSELTCSQTGYSTDDACGFFGDRGTLLFVPADVYLHGRTSAGLERGAYCLFDSDWFETLTGFGRDWSADMLSACINIKSPQLIRAMSRLGQEAMAPGFASTELTQGLATLIAVELARHLRSADAKPKATIQQLSPWQLRKITSYVESLVGYAPDIDEIADLCGVSSRHLRRLFKQTTDQTIYEYARDAWAAKAKHLLSDTDLPLKEIWSRMGFASPSSFSVAFSRATGVSPKAFRQRFHQPRCASVASTRNEERLLMAS